MLVSSTYLEIETWHVQIWTCHVSVSRYVEEASSGGLIFFNVIWLIEYTVSVLWLFPCMLPSWHHHIYLNIFSFNISDLTWVPNTVIPCTITQSPMMILCTQSGIWSAIWSDGSGDGNDMLSYFTVIAGGSSVSMVVCRILMTAPVQIATWKFETPEVSQVMFHGSFYDSGLNFCLINVNNFSIW